MRSHTPTQFLKFFRDTGDFVISGYVPTGVALIIISASLGRVSYVVMLIGQVASSIAY